MTATSKKYLTAFAASAVLALGLYGCGGGGGRGPATGEPQPMPVDLVSVTAGFMAGAGTVQVPAGQSVDHGDIAFTCAAGGADCEIMVTVDANGAVTATSTGGMVTAMNSDAYTARITPMAVDLASLTAGFMAGAGTVQVAAGQSVDHGDIAFTCAAGGADCEIMVTVDANGAITATSTGGTVTAMNSDAYTARNRDHRRSSTAITRDSANPSTVRSTITRRSLASTISIRPVAGWPAATILSDGGLIGAASGS